MQRSSFFGHRSGPPAPLVCAIGFVLALLQVGGCSTSGSTSDGSGEGGHGGGGGTSTGGASGESGHSGTGGAPAGGSGGAAGNAAGGASGGSDGVGGKATGGTSGGGGGSAGKGVGGGSGGAGGAQMYSCGSDTCTVGESFCYQLHARYRGTYRAILPAHAGGVCVDPDVLRVSLSPVIQFSARLRTGRHGRWKFLLLHRHGRRGQPELRRVLKLNREKSAATRVC
jgi:hypothetical protein